MRTSLCSSINKLEVCQGPDCFGGGGGAAILEMEELLQEYEANCKVELVRGGCRNFCTMGPNVHYSSSEMPQQHFTKVQTVEDCSAIIHQLVVSVGAEDDVKATTAREPIAIRMMRKKAERQRWEFLRQVARVKRKQHDKKKNDIHDNPNSNAALRTQLEQVMTREMSAAKEDPNLVERAQRRNERFHVLLESM